MTSNDNIPLSLDTVPCAATVGFFDGVHLGHQYLLQQLCTLSSARGLKSMAVTFNLHPRQVLHSDWQPRLLTTLGEKRRRLSLTGVDSVTVLPFDLPLASLSARQFMEQVLRDRLGVKVLLVGYDHHFGHREAGAVDGFEQYAAYGRELGIDVVCGHPLTLDMGPVSSSLVRRLLDEGRVDVAARCLGRNYLLDGLVVHGAGQGRQLGFPTANLKLTDDCRLVPRNGGYAVEVTLPGHDIRFPGMTNIGTRPTFDGHCQTIETHILGFSGNLYGQPIGLHFRCRLRDERAFSSPNELAQQMSADAHEVKRIVGY